MEYFAVKPAFNVSLLMVFNQTVHAMNDANQSISSTPGEIRDSQQSAPSSRSVGGLLSLPSELIELIARSLSPVSSVCFSLASRRLYLLLSLSANCSLQYEDQKRDVLLLLKHDLPEMLLCHRCIKLLDWKTP
jgi:hypothetical protein